MVPFRPDLAFELDRIVGNSIEINRKSTFVAKYKLPFRRLRIQKKDEALKRSLLCGNRNGTKKTFLNEASLKRPKMSEANIKHAFKSTFSLIIASPHPV